MASGKRGGQELAEVLTRPTCPVTFFLSCLLDLLPSLPMDYSKASLPSGAFLLLFARRVSGLAGKAGPCCQRLEILALFIWRPPRDKVALLQAGCCIKPERRTLGWLAEGHMPPNYCLVGFSANRTLGDCSFSPCTSYILKWEEEVFPPGHPVWPTLCSSVMGHQQMDSKHPLWAGLGQLSEECWSRLRS